MIMERFVFHAGKTFLEAGQAGADAYIIQSGEAHAYVYSNKGEKIEVSKHVSGDIVGELNLISNEMGTVNYEAITDVTAVRIVRQDFEKKLKRADQTLYDIITKLVQKLKDQEKRWALHVLDGKHVDYKALEIVDHLLRNVKGDRKPKYEEVLLPHFNIMVRALEDLKKEK